MIKKKKRRGIAGYYVSIREEFIFHWFKQIYRRLGRKIGSAKLLCIIEQFRRKYLDIKMFLICGGDAIFAAGSQAVRYAANHSIADH